MLTPIMVIPSFEPTTEVEVLVNPDSIELIAPANPHSIELITEHKFIHAQTYIKLKSGEALHTTMTYEECKKLLANQQ